CADPLGHRPRRRRRVTGPGAPAGGARGGAGLHRGGRRRPGLPAGGGPRPHLGEAARTAARGRVAAVPHRLGRPVPGPGGVRQRRAHPRRLAGVRGLAGGGGAGHRDRRGDGGHRRRCGALVRPAVPLPRPAARQRQVRADAAAEPGEAAPDRCGGHRRSAADRRRVRQPGPGAGARGTLMRVAEAAGRGLVACGVRTCFGVVGSGNFHVTNALIDAGARFVAAAHEGGAATMADAYARTSGELAALSVHQGPGVTNALTGVAEAAKSRTPLVVLAPEATAARSNFRIDLASAATAVGATFHRVRAERVDEDVAHACRTAVAGAGRTVVLGMPLDVQAAPAGGDRPGTPPLPGGSPAAGSPAAGSPAAGSPAAGSPAAGDRPPPPDPGGGPAPSADQVRALVALLRAARRPVFIAGRGAARGRERARTALAALAQACGALLAVSASAKGLFAGDPWYLDVSGGFASPLAAELISASDVVVAWGSSLNMWTTRH